MQSPSAVQSLNAIQACSAIQACNGITRIPVQLGEGGEVTQVYYTLDGSTSYIQSDFDPSAIGTGDISISCWIRVDTVPSGTKYVWILGNDNLDNSLSLRIRSTKLEVFGRVGTEDEIEVTAANTIVPDLWTHVVVTRTGTTIELFVNGTSNASGTNIEAAASLSDGETWIGYHSGVSSFAGDFANFEIRNAVLTDSEIYNNFNAGTAYTTGTEQEQTLTPTNATTTNSDLPGDWSNRWGFYFDGVNDYIEVPDSDNLSLIDGSNDAACSFEAWIYPQSTTNFMICSKTQDSNNREYMLRLSSGRVQLLLYDGSFSNFLQLIQTASLSADTWHHIIVTYDGSEVHTGLNLYINGASEAATTSSGGTYNGQNNTTGPLNIGRWTIGGHATGLIDEFVIHSKELSSAEVATRYNAGTPTDPRSLNPIYYLHEATGADWSGNNHLATLQSGAEITANVPVVTLPAWENSHSLDFNGSSANITIPSTPFSVGTGDFTFSTWFKIDTASTLQYLFSCNNTAGLSIGVDASDNITVLCATASAITGSISIVTGTWYFLSVVRSSGTVTIYLNAFSDGSGSAAGSITIGDSRIGSLSTDASYLDGHLAHPSFHNVALDIDAITKLASEPIDLTSDDGDYDNSSDLVAYWPFISGAGAGALDHSGNSNHGTIIDATWTTDLPVPAFNRYSVNFDGIDDYMSVPDSNDLSFGNASTDSAFSISAWIKNDSIGATQRIVTKASSTSSIEYMFTINGSNQLGLYLYDGSSGNRIGATTNIALSSGVWYHVVATYDGNGANTGINLYVDTNTGTRSLDSAGSYVAMHNTSDPVRVGSLSYASQYFDGKIDSLAIFNYELSAANVSTIYNGGEVSDISSLSPVAHWRMGDNDSGTGTTITNQGSASGIDGTLTNGPTFSSDVPT